MGSSIENTFGSKIRKYKNRVVFIGKWERYDPPRQEDSLANLQAFGEKVEAGNTAAAASAKQYKDAVASRQKLFRKEPYSIDKILRLIRASLLSQYDKKSSIYKQVAGMIKELRATRLITPPADPANPEKAHAISSSQQSYGSRTLYFGNIVTTLNEQEDYKSSNPLLTKGGLTARIAHINDANDNVAATLKDITDSRDSRNKDYEEMDAKTTRMKGYALSEYGVDSKEYKEMMSQD